MPLECLFVGVALDNYRLVVDQLAMTTVISPDPTSAWEGSCTTEPPPEHVESAQNPIILANRTRPAINARNEDDQ